MRMPTKLALVAAGLLSAIGLALATGSSWLNHFGVGDGHRFTVEHSDGAHTVLQVDKHPKDPGTNTIAIDVKLTIAALGVLNSMALQTADDTNSNGLIEEGEWTTVATASIAQQGNKTIATLPTYTVPGGKAAVRVLMNRTDIGLTWDMVALNGVQVDISQY